MSRDDFNGVLGFILRKEFGEDWKREEDLIEIDDMQVFDLLREVEIRSGETPVNQVAIRDMTLKDFVVNMIRAFGFA